MKTTEYSAPSCKVINFTSVEVLCASQKPYGTRHNPFEDEEDWGI